MPCLVPLPTKTGGDTAVFHRTRLLRTILMDKTRRNIDTKFTNIIINKLIKKLPVIYVRVVQLFNLDRQH